MAQSLEQAIKDQPTLLKKATGYTIGVVSSTAAFSAVGALMEYLMGGPENAKHYALFGASVGAPAYVAAELLAEGVWKLYARSMEKSR